MLNDLFQAIIVLGIAYTIFKLFELYARRKERIMMIEKMSFGDGMINPPDVTKWFSPPTPTSWALRLGLLLTGIGLGLVIAVVTNYFMSINIFLLKYPNSRFDDVLYFASMLLFGGIGLTIAYLIEQKNRKKD